MVSGERGRLDRDMRLTAVGDGVAERERAGIGGVEGVMLGGFFGVTATGDVSGRLEARDEVHRVAAGESEVTL